MSHLPRFHTKTIYTAGQRLIFDFALCDFQLRANVPELGVSEMIGLIGYFPNL